MLSTSVNWLHSYTAPSHSRSSFALTRHFTQQFCSLKVLKLSCFIVFIHAHFYVETHTKNLFRNTRREWIKADLSLGHKLHVCQSLHSELASLVNWQNKAKHDRQLAWTCCLQEFLGGLFLPSHIPTHPRRHESSTEGAMTRHGALVSLESPPQISLQLQGV